MGGCGRVGVGVGACVWHGVCACPAQRGRLTLDDGTGGRRDTKWPSKSIGATPAELMEPGGAPSAGAPGPSDGWSSSGPTKLGVGGASGRESCCGVKSSLPILMHKARRPSNALCAGCVRDGARKQCGVRDGSEG